MLKQIHMLFVVLSFAGFTSRIIMAEINPYVLKLKWVRIAPHVIDTLLLLSGVLLVFAGNWLSSDYSWIIAKIIALLLYIALGVLAMRIQGKIRWLAFTGAVLCFLYIARVAVSKQVWFFL
ncbi:MAG: SirB2 family protein [Gammaproteobacteria bacterium]